MTLYTQTGLGYSKIYNNQAILITTRYRPIKGLLLNPSPKKSLVRFIENDRITEKRIDNQKILPLPWKPQKQNTSQTPKDS
jgi:hypothetical protein